MRQIWILTILVIVIAVTARVSVYMGRPTPPQPPPAIVHGHLKIAGLHLGMSRAEVERLDGAAHDQVAGGFLYQGRDGAARVYFRPDGIAYRIRGWRLTDPKY